VLDLVRGSVQNSALISSVMFRVELGSPARRATISSATWTRCIFAADGLIRIDPWKDLGLVAVVVPVPEPPQHLGSLRSFHILAQFGHLHDLVRMLCPHFGLSLAKPTGQ
jgi:hypothetical protein